MMLSNLYNKISDISRRGLGPRMLIVNVKFNSNYISSVNIDPTSKVIELKKLICDRIRIPVEEIGIILGGQLFADDSALEDCGIGNQSTLHAYQQKLEAVAKATSDSDNESTRTNQYFVFCKLCKTIRPGKLRVKCFACKDGAFMVERGPQGWEDVLQSTRIKGKCMNSDCPGDVAEFSFKCASSHSGDLEGTCAVLHHIRPNCHQIECILCADIHSPVLVYPCQDGHVICLSCFKMYGLTQLNDRKFVKHPEYGYTLPCPAGCDNSYIEESHHFHLLGDDQYERFNRFATEEYVLQHGGVLCPGPGCGMGMFLDSENRRVTCVSDSCKMAFCRDCLCDYHDGPCEPRVLFAAIDNNFPVDEERAQRARWDFEARDLIHKTTKSCPGCGARTEKAGGCMHMQCTRCQCEWCWVCEKEWDRTCQGDHWFGS